VLPAETRALERSYGWWRVVGQKLTHYRVARRVALVSARGARSETCIAIAHRASDGNAGGRPESQTMMIGWQIWSGIIFKPIEGSNEAPFHKLW